MSANFVSNGQDLDEIFVLNSELNDLIGNSSLYTCGHNHYGQLGLSDLTDRSSPTQVSSTTNWREVSAGHAQNAAIKADGTFWAWGENQQGQLGLGDTLNRINPVQVGTLNNYAKVSSGTNITCIIKTDGTLWT